MLTLHTTIETDVRRCVRKWTLVCNPPPEIFLKSKSHSRTQRACARALCFACKEMLHFDFPPPPSCFRRVGVHHRLLQHAAKFRWETLKIRNTAAASSGGPSVAAPTYSSVTTRCCRYLRQFAKPNYQLYCGYTTGGAAVRRGFVVTKQGMALNRDKPPPPP